MMNNACRLEHGWKNQRSPVEQARSRDRAEETIGAVNDVAVAHNLSPTPHRTASAHIDRTEVVIDTER